jgi:hypothetical protein
MAYTINLTDGTVFATIPDGTVNTSTSALVLVGKNYAGYGEFLDENFIRLLENSSNTTAPVNPLVGQLWWDKGNSLLKVHIGGNIFKTISAATSSPTAPSSNVVGDLWYDTVNQQLKVWTGASFLVVGPAFTSSEGVTGAVPAEILDSGASPHPVVLIQIDGQTYSIISRDATFTPQDPGIAAQFPRIYPGVNVRSGSTGTSGTGVLAGNVTNAGNIVFTAGFPGNANATVTVTNIGANVVGYHTVTGNITGANLVTTGLITVGGNVQGGNLLTAGIVNATGNVTGGNIVTGGNVLATGQLSSSGNIQGGNLRTIGLASIAGNVNGGNLIANLLIQGQNLTVSANVQGGNLRTTGLVSATGNITSSGNVSGQFFIGNGSQLTGISAAVSVTKFVNGTTEGNIGTTGGNINFNVSGTSNVCVMSPSGVIVNGLSAPSIEKTGSNSVGNIGSSSNFFNRVFATATTALYADVAERFEADEVLDAGTVVELGGEKEITRAREDLSENVFGVISTRAAYLMNGGAGDDQSHPPVAMTGRVPVRVIGVVRKGDRLVSAGNGLARAARLGEATSFNVIGRSLNDKLDADQGIIEAIVSIK